MEVLAVLLMIVAGGAVAVFFLVALTIAKVEDAPRRGSAAVDRDQIAASLLFHILAAGGVPPDEALRRLRRDAGVGARVTRGVDVLSWAETYSRAASAPERERLLDTAVRLAIARTGPVPLRVYASLLDLSFGLGFHSDALARLRERYGFEYVDHAKDGRPREADRAGGAAPLFVRSEQTTAAWLRALEIDETPTRQTIVAAYRRLAAKHHPDRFHDQPDEVQRTEAAKFIEITTAYEGLLAVYRD